MTSVTNRESMRYLTEPLREIAQHHLNPDETVLTAVYIKCEDRFVLDRWLGLKWLRQVHQPTRAFVLTPERALIVEDPTDPATSTADCEYLFASCTLDRVMLFELRSHLLDCALTLVMATPNGPEHITIEYSGVVQWEFLVAVAYMRALADRQPLPAYMSDGKTYARERTAAWKGWHSALSGLGLKLENTVADYLVPGEQVQEWLKVPAIDESTWWQRLGIGAHEQPPAVLVRTDQQILLVKETKRIVHGETTYGSDVWLMPSKCVRTACIVSGQREPEIQLTLGHMGVTDVVRLPILPELAERALVLVKSS